MDTKDHDPTLERSDSIVSEKEGKLVSQSEKKVSYDDKPKDVKKSKQSTQKDRFSHILELSPLVRKTTPKETDSSDVRVSKHKSSKVENERQTRYSMKRGPSKSVTLTRQSHSSMISTVSGSSMDQDVVTLTVPETAQKIAHCLVGKNLFVDKTWCMVKKKDLLEDIAIEDANSPFFHLTHKLLEYKPDELLIGYEPFASEPNQFMLCMTEAGRDEVLARLEEMKSSYLQRIQQSKEVKPKKWNSLGSEEFVDSFQVKNTRKLISLEWIGDIVKRCQKPPVFQDCDPDDMKNGYTCLIPTEKEKFELVYRKTQETGVQAVPSQVEAEVQTEPEIPTNASTQYAPETEIVLPDTAVTQATIKSQDLDTFFKKYKDYLMKCLKYNEVYDLYHDDYPALYVPGEETQVQQLGVYHQYQSFTDVAAIQGKLVVSSAWHPNYTGIVAIAYANEIPCLMQELEFDSDQTDYEEEKTDGEDEAGEEVELGTGARDWLEDEKRERESTGENTELYERAVRRLKDIESAKGVWDAKIQEQTEEIRKSTEGTVEAGEMFADLLHYREYIVEPEPEPEPEPEEITSQKSEDKGEGEEGEGEGEEGRGELGVLKISDEPPSHRSSRIVFRQQLEADIAESNEKHHATAPASSVSIVDDLFAHPGDMGTSRTVTASTHGTAGSGQRSRQHSLALRSSRNTTGSLSSSRKLTHHQKKLKVIPSLTKIQTRKDDTRTQTRREEGRTKTHTEGRSRTRRESRTRTRKEEWDMESVSSDDSSSFESRTIDVGREKEQYMESEFFDEVTDEEEIKEKQDELPLLEVNNPVLIWSFVDDLTPKLRLDSPYEVRTIAFSKHNGNLIVGGTSSGQIVLWDITGRIEELEKPENLTQNQQMFRKRMETLMKWRRDIRSKRRVRLTAISSQKDSHLEKITDLFWVIPTVVISERMEILSNPSDYSLQILSSSIYGTFSVWDLKTEPGKSEHRRVPLIFKTKERFGRPASLDMGLSPYHKLNRVWKPICKRSVMFKGLPVLLTGFQSTSVGFPGKFNRVKPKLSGVKELLEDRIEYKAEYPATKNIPHSMYLCNLFGQVGTIVYDPSSATEDIINIYNYWDSYHDRPITRLCKHPFIPSLCLTVGGHVFAIWHMENKEEPILAKRYYGGVYVADGSWSSLRPSLIRIARSDGVVEIWDLIIQNHAPATTIIVSGRVITNISAPLLPEVRGLLGVADYNSAFCLFFIPQQFRVWTESELERLRKFISREPERRKEMKMWSKWWKENNVNVEREERKQAEEKKKLDEEVRLEKEKQEEARKKYNEEVYKWYMRRRGKSFLKVEEADDKWREKQEEYMHEMVMAKKKIDRTEMEILMRPIVREEKNEALKHAKAQDRLKQADTIFKQTVELIFPKASKVAEVKSEEQDLLSEQVTKLVDYYFGTSFEELAAEQEEFIAKSPWQFEFEWSELLEKYNTLRMLFNDRRRKRSKTLRWLRKKLTEELTREGRKVHVRKSHKDRYPKRKIKRRQENLAWLHHTYGDDYNVYWDKHLPCRRFTDRKFRYAPVDEVDGSFLGELSEPDVEDEELPEILEEGKVLSNLEMITEMGIEHVPEEAFAADLDTVLLTLESRSSLGVKTVPSLIVKPSGQSQEPTSSRAEEKMSLVMTPASDYLTVPGMQSPKDESDLSGVLEDLDETITLVDNQQQELDYIKQPVGTKINTVKDKRTYTAQKKEISHGIKVRFDDSSTDDDLIIEGSLEGESEAQETQSKGEEEPKVEDKEGDEQVTGEEGEKSDEDNKELSMDTEIPDGDV